MEHQEALETTGTAARRYCVDCAFFRPGSDMTAPSAKIQFGRCAKGAVDQKITGYHFVSPEFPTPNDLPYAAVMRLQDCGPDAKWFEPKPVEQVMP